MRVQTLALHQPDHYLTVKEAWSSVFGCAKYCEITHQRR